MAGRIVLFGATGYTGERTARALVARGARPVLAARSAGRVERLAADLGGLETRVADVARPESVRVLVERGDVLVTTVGPFARWGGAAVDAAIAAAAHYLDSTGEPAFIRRVFEDSGPRAAAAGSLLLTAFGFDWLPGNLAGVLALRQAGPEATRVLVAYLPRGGRVSGGTAASTAGALLEPSFAHRGGRLRTERTGARVGTFGVGDGIRRRGLSVGGSEHVALPRLYPQLTEVEVLLGTRAATRALPLLTGAVALATALPPLRAAAQALAGRRSSTGGPTEAELAAGSSTVVALARGADGRPLARVRLDGPDGYTFTAEMLAWGALAVAGGQARTVGAAGPAEAFGLEALEAAAAAAGLRRWAPTG